VTKTDGFVCFELWFRSSSVESWRKNLLWESWARYVKSWNKSPSFVAFEGLLRALEWVTSLAIAIMIASFVIVQKRFQMTEKSYLRPQKSDRAQIWTQRKLLTSPDSSVSCLKSPEIVICPGRAWERLLSTFWETRNLISSFAELPFLEIRFKSCFQSFVSKQSLSTTSPGSSPVRMC
jgi:hypothetical protein